MLDVVVNHRCASLQALNDLSDCNIYQIKSPKPRQNLTNPRLKLAKSAHLIVQFVPFHDENVWNLSKRSVHGNNFAGFRRQVAEVWGQTWWVRIPEADCASGCFPMKKKQHRWLQAVPGCQVIWRYMIYVIYLVPPQLTTKSDIFWFLWFLAVWPGTRLGRLGGLSWQSAAQCVKNLYMVFVVCFPLSLSAFGGELVRRSFLVLFLFALYLHNLFVVFLLTFGCFMQHSSHTSV